MTQPVIARIEAGRATPAIASLERIADALGVELVVQLRPPSLEAARADLAAGDEGLLDALDRRAPQLVSSAAGPDLSRFVRPYLDHLLELRFERHPWARLLVAWAAFQDRRDRGLVEDLVDASWRSFRRSRNLAGQGYVAFVRGQLALSRGDLQVAGDWWRAARELLGRGVGGEGIDELSLTNTALAYYMQGDLEACSTAAREAVVLAQLRPNRAAEGFGLICLSLVALNRGQFDVAEAQLERADAAYDALTRPEDQYPRSLVETCRGALLAMRGDLEGANRAFAHSESVPDPWFPYVARAVRAELTAAMQPEEAEVAALAALEESMQRADIWWRTWAERGLAVAALTRGDLQAALDIATSINDTNPLERGRTLLVLGDIHLALGDRKAATASLQEAARLFEERGASYWLVRTLVLLAEAQPTKRASLFKRARSLATDDRAFQLLLEPAPSGMVLRLAEPRRVFVGGHPVRFASRRAEQLLYLLVDDSPLPWAIVAGKLWPGTEPAHAAQNLRTALWHARLALGPEAWRLERRSGALRLVLDGVVVDRTTRRV